MANPTADGKTDLTLFRPIIKLHCFCIELLYNTVSRTQSQTELSRYTEVAIWGISVLNKLTRRFLSIRSRNVPTACNRPR